MRRNLLPAILAILLVPATVAMVLHAMAEPPISILPFLKPTHRVAIAVDEAMQSEFTGVKQGACTLAQDFRFATITPGTAAIPAVVSPQPDKLDLDESLNAFWLAPGGSPAPTLMTLQKMEIEGKARDGRTVKATITGDPFGDGSLVDFHGDAESARLLEPKIAAILARPKYPHDSPEDRAALSAFYSSQAIPFPWAVAPNLATVPKIAVPTPQPVPPPLGVPPFDEAVSKAGGVDPAPDPK